MDTAFHFCILDEQVHRIDNNCLYCTINKRTMPGILQLSSKKRNMFQKSKPRITDLLNPQFGGTTYA